MVPNPAASSSADKASVAVVGGLESGIREEDEDGDGAEEDEGEGGEG